MYTKWKQMTFIVLAVALCLSLGACGKGSGTSGNSGGGENSAPQEGSAQGTDQGAASGNASQASGEQSGTAGDSGDDFVEEDDGVDVSGMEVMDYNSILIAGNSAYEYYGFNEETADWYASVIKAAGEKLSGQAKVYALLAPTNMDVTLPTAIRKTVSSGDQGKAMEYIYGKIGPGVNCVNVLNNLKKHKKEYIYFRTDHHWTSLGAYYAYEKLMGAMGKTPNPVTGFKAVNFEQFLGSFYELAPLPQLAETPDTVTAYIPKGTNDLKYTDTNGNVVAWKVIEDVSDWNDATKFNTFISGDNPYVVIENPQITDGSACLVVKESYANALVPFLVDHYQTVHVVDYRYIQTNMDAFLKEHPVNDVIFINYINAGLADSNLTNLEKFVKAW